jgi:ankyrin repeat protein
MAWYTALLHDAVAKSFVACVVYLLNLQVPAAVVGAGAGAASSGGSACQWAFDVNHRLSDGGHSALHIAARKNDLQLMSVLIRYAKADPLLCNAMYRTALQMLAVQAFPPLASAASASASASPLNGAKSPSAAAAATAEPERVLHGLAYYMNKPNLSDVTFKVWHGTVCAARRCVER